MFLKMLRLLVSCILLCLLVSLPAAFAEENTDDPDGLTDPVDYRTALADGVYVPDKCTFRGGSGKVTIACREILVEDGLSYAVLEFSSNSYPYIKASGKIAYPATEGKKSYFTIPFALNRENRILATTTKMGTPHEIEYYVTVFSALTGEIPEILPEDVPETIAEAEVNIAATAADELRIIEGLTFLEETALEYARCFRIFRYEGGYSLVCVPQSGYYLVVPDGSPVPDGLSGDITVLQQPLDRIYLAATSAMALFDATDAVDAIRLTGTRESGWYIESAAEAIRDGRMLFAGKYSEPDYEMLLAENCSLAIESTMIFHTPKVMEMIRQLGIPVLVDRSSYESHPLGRTEWIKLYAVLTGKEAEAEAFFREQSVIIEQLQNFPNTEKTVAFFFVNSDGSVVVRNPKDYIPQMVEIAGGWNVCPELPEDTTGTAISVTMESFYAAAWDADYIIYNSSIDLPLDSMEQLLAKNSLFADFRAVQNGNVWCTGRSFYQETDIVGEMIRDIHNMLTDCNESQMTFLTRVR